MACGGCRQGSVRVEADLTSKNPTLETDGSIMFPEGDAVPVVEGYTVDENDPQRLVPDDDCACFYKITGIMLQRNGEYSPHHVCRHPECEHKTKTVTPDICKGCPFRTQEG
ncbi:MAG: hypothetical protein ACXABY_16750 [Candidatus Thorarchaeota archaeon]|jgi:hypothetical protein